MPTAPLRPCLAPGCPEKVSTGRCAAHQQKREQEKGTAHERGYDARWRKARVRFLELHPLCAGCAKEGRTTAARVVDHVIPHKGDQQLFWDESNWQPLCDYTSPWDCHGKKSRQDGGLGG